MPPRAVVFDMDGLMFDTERLYALVGTELLRRRGRVFTEELMNAVMGLRPQPTFETMIRWHHLDDDWEQLTRESSEIFAALLDEHLTAMPGLFELLDALEAAGVPKAIGTSSARSAAEACLAPFDLEPRFAFVLSSEDVARGKPDPEIYLTAAARFQLPAAELLVLEDSHYGCQAAVAAGAYTVAVPAEQSRTHDFSAASLVVDSLADRRLYAVLGIDWRTG